MNKTQRTHPNTRRPVVLTKREVDEIQRHGVVLDPTWNPQATSFRPNANIGHRRGAR